MSYRDEVADVLGGPIHRLEEAMVEAGRKAALPADQVARDILAIRRATAFVQ